MKRDEPTPLTHAGSEDRELLELLEAGRSDLPASDTVDALEARIVPLLLGPPSSFPPPGAAPSGGAGASGGGAASAAAGSSAAGLAGGATAAKLVTAAVIATAIGAGTWSLATRPATPAAPTSAPAETTQDAIETRRADPAPEPAPAPEPDTVTAPIEPPSTALAEPEPIEQRVRASPRAARPEAPASVHAAREEPPPPETEALLLSRAQAALESSPREALSLTVEHERTFTSGMLAPEREVIAIDALLRLGRRDHALARADRFLARSPHSAHARRVRVLISSEGP